MATKKSLMQRLFYNCDEATTHSTKQVYGKKLGFLSWFRFWIHNITCFPCWHFHEDNKKMQKILKLDCTPKHVLSEEKKKEMETKLRDLKLT